MQLTQHIQYYSTSFQRNLEYWPWNCLRTCSCLNQQRKKYFFKTNKKRELLQKFALATWSVHRTLLETQSKKKKHCSIKVSFSLDYQKFIDKLTKELKQNISLNHRMALVGRDLKDTVPTPCHGLAATYLSACPKSHTSWLWMPPGLRRPHLLWAICFSASPLSESRITPHTSTAGSCSPGPPSPPLQRCSQWVLPFCKHMWDCPTQVHHVAFDLVQLHSVHMGPVFKHSKIPLDGTSSLIKSNFHLLNFSHKNKEKLCLSLKKKKIFDFAIILQVKEAVTFPSDPSCFQSKS